eukprot:1278545-Amphidinium_carterae.1
MQAIQPCMQHADIGWNWFPSETKFCTTCGITVCKLGIGYLINLQTAELFEPKIRVFTIDK